MGFEQPNQQNVNKEEALEQSSQPNIKKEETAETLENKIERLKPTFEKSFFIYSRFDEYLKENEDGKIWDAEMKVTRKLEDGATEIINALVCFGINEDGPELGLIDDEGEPLDSGTMLWKELVSAEFYPKEQK